MSAARPIDGTTASMRIDRYLWHVRMAGTRSQAQALIEQGRCRIDGRPIDRAHAPVRIGQVLTFVQGQGVRVIRVGALPPRRGSPAVARTCYDELTTPTAKPNANTDPPPEGPTAR